MYDYMLLDNFSNNINYSYRYGCREYLIKSYALRTIKPPENSVFYFGHVSNNIKYPYSRICDEIWKGAVPYEIIKLKDIPICPNNPEMFKQWQSDYKDISLIKIGDNIHPPDISLILYISWYGKMLSASNSLKEYYFAKVYTDLIPNFYTKGNEDNDARENSLISANGPDTYMWQLELINSPLAKRLRKLAKEHNLEWTTKGV